MHIENLYKSQQVLYFSEVYALEKIHGTSAHIGFKRIKLLDQVGEGPERVIVSRDDVQVTYFSGGEKYESFKALFNEEELKKRFLEIGAESMTVYGEAYGGKCQGMKATYGPNLKFVAFDVEVSRDRDPNAPAGSSLWLGVEQANLTAAKLGLDFVAWNKVKSDVDSLNRERDLPSRQAVKNGITEPRIAEGIVIRPPIEVVTNNGSRTMAKHKRPEFSERASKKDTTVSPEKQATLTKAEEIAAEWVVPHRLEHVLGKLKATLGRDPELKDMREVINAMVEDVTREAKGEIVESKEAAKAIGSATSKLFRRLLMNQLPTYEAASATLAEVSALNIEQIKTTFGLKTFRVERHRRFEQWQDSDPTHGRSGRGGQVSDGVVVRPDDVLDLLHQVLS